MDRPALESLLELLEEAAIAESLHLGSALESDIGASGFCATLKKSCASKVNHPVKGATYRSLQARLPEISGALLDSAIRAQLGAVYAERFAAVRSTQLAHLRDVMARQKHSGKMLDKGLRDALVKEYVTGHGCVLAEADIDATAAAVGLDREVAPDRPLVELHPINEVRKLIADLKVLDAENLYGFLGVQSAASDAEISAKLGEKKNEWAQKRADQRKTAAQAVLSRAASWLSGDGRLRYDLTLAYLELEKSGVWKHLAAYAADHLLEPAEMADLRQMGTDLNFSPDEVDDLVRYEASRRGVKVSTPPASVPMKRCGYCGRSSELEARACTNLRCGKPFEIRCMQCGATYQSGTGACSKCGTTLSMQVQIQDGVVAIDRALGRNDFETANDLANALGARHGSNTQVRQVVERVKNAMAQQERELADVGRLRAERRLVAAVALLDSAATAGRLSENGKSQLAALRSDIARAEQLVLAAVGRSEAEGLAALESAYAICADSPRIHAEAARFRPEPPKMMTTDQRDGLIALKWAPSPSVGVSGYRVLRKLDSAPGGPTDGVEIAFVGTTRFEDATAPVGRRTYYSVTAERLGVASAPLFSPPSVRTAPVEDVRITASSNWVRVTWQLPAGASGVLVTRSSGRERTTIPASKEGFTDSSVVNGTEYGYSVQAEFAVPDGVRRSVGVKFAVVPKMPPKPPGNPVAHINGKDVSIRFEADDDASVVVVRSITKPGLSEGQLVDMNELEAAGELIRSAHPGTASDTLRSGGVYYYTVASIDPPQAAVGPTVCVLALDDCTELKTYPKELEVVAKWTWPAQAKTSILALTRGKPAESATDPAATRLEVSRQEYDNGGEYSFTVPSSDDYHLRVFAGYAGDDGHLYARGDDPSSRTVFHAGTKGRMTYALTKSLFGRYQLKISGPTGMIVPSFALVAKPSFAPISATDGTVFFTVATSSLESGTKSVELPSPPKGHCLKVFFDDPLSYDTVQISHPPADSLKVK